MLFLKQNSYTKALDELREVEELEKTLYGDSSTQVAKTYKVIGTLHIINNNPQEAREYLMRAYSIFESKGMVKLLKEVRMKLKMINQRGEITGEMAAKEAVDSGDDSGHDSPPEKAKTKKKAMAAGLGVKKGAKGKKKVFRDNFMKEHP